MVMDIKSIKTEDWKVVRVIRFYEELLNIKGTICYMRPLTYDYNKETIDDFDNSMIRWLKSLQLKNVKVIKSENMLFDSQQTTFSRIYDSNRPQTKLSLNCSGNYTDDNIVGKGEIRTINLSLNIFWDTNNKGTLSDIYGAVTFDKDKEDYFFDVIKGVTSL